MSDTQNLESAVFDAALQLPPEQRAAHVRQACGADAQMCGRILALLQAHENAGGFLAEPAVDAAPKTIALSFPVTEKAGDQIGRYKLLQQIGEGGCGVVYMAEQAEPVRRRVALKVIKLGMDTKNVIARFEAERQALALMDHPNIAKVLDAGATENGRPFFVMELVRGVKINEYCDQNKLSTGERLKLFVQVCHAIQHAHQKGIIHRDIKPSNILVTLHDGVPVPKVIDFGIAKATQGRLTDQTLFTAFEQFIGTPAYMSPEQAEMSGLDIDTRSDIYALGVLLYELLTGTPPFDPKELLRSGLDELRRTIREQEPARPSTRLGTMLQADLTAVASRRQLEAPRLVSLIRGDLDWIVMKALEKDRTRRFDTANGLAADIQRYLNNEPVTARPPSTAYRFQKLVRRNKLAFAAALIVVAALALGFGVSTVLFVKERAARQRADAAERVQSSLRKQAENGLRLEAEKHARAQIGEKLGLGALYLTQGKYAESEEELAPVPVPVLTNYIALAAVFNALGEMHAHRAEWPAALTNYSKVVAIVPTDYPGCHLLALLLAETGHTEMYARHCEQMLRQFSGMTDPAMAAGIAEDCLLRPLPAADLAAVGTMAATALAVPETNRTAQILFLEGLLEYRRGNYASAVDWLGKAADAPDGDRYAYAESQMVSALAQYQLKDIAKAHDTLAEGLAYIDKKIAKPPDDGFSKHWEDYLVVQILQREAGVLMPETAAPAWQDKLHQAGLTFTASQLDNGTWEVGIDNQPLTNLTLLSGVPISRLSLMRTKVADLSPLRGMPLKTLQLAGTAVTDIGPLQGMTLELLQLSQTAVTNIDPLRGMPLKVLNLTDCAGITNLDALAGMTTLQSLILPPNAGPIQFLRGLTNLTRLSFRYDPATKRAAQSTAAFWAEYDQTHP